MARRLLALSVLVLAALAGAAVLQARVAGAKGAAPRRDALVRGKYLVDGVAMCSECHTPRDARGKQDRSRYLQGAPTWITPVHTRPDWAHYAPALAGMGSYTDEQMETILEKDVGPNGLPLQAPMHDYRMSPEDAQAIVAYLRSLPAPR